MSDAPAAAERHLRGRAASDGPACRRRAVGPQGLQDMGSPPTSSRCQLVKLWADEIPTRRGGLLDQAARRSTAQAGLLRGFIRWWRHHDSLIPDCLSFPPSPPGSAFPARPVHRRSDSPAAASQEGLSNSVQISDRRAWGNRALTNPSIATARWRMAHFRSRFVRCSDEVVDHGLK
jgi:hypothetical protein